MSNEKLRDLLVAIHEELEGTDADAETRAMLKSLDAEIHELVGDDAGESHAATVTEQAKLLEARFATSHPVAERIMREFVDTLVKLGL
jgi:hypothetical protein